MPYTQFKQGDIVQLIKDTALHNKGDIGTVERITAYGDLEIKYYGESGIICSSPEWFRLIDLDILRGKK